LSHALSGTTRDLDPGALRAEYPVLARCAYLNTGTAGPLSRRVVEAVGRALEGELAEGRGSFGLSFRAQFELREDLRRRFARLLGAEPDEVALTQHTTAGINAVVWGLRWAPGDEIVLSSHEHEGGLLPAYAAARHLGLGVRVVEIGRGDGDVAGAVEAALGARTRLLVISHLSYKTGSVLPIAEIAAAAHRRGVFVAVDGAQSAGTIPVDVRALGADAYAVSGQKWLCGPEGVGALYVRGDRLGELSPTAVGHFALRDLRAIDLSGYFLPAAGAARFEGGTTFWPALAGMRESLVQLEEMGLERVMEAGRRATEAARRRLLELPGVELVSPPGSVALTAFRLPGAAPHRLVPALLERGVVLRSVEHPAALRISTGFFTGEADLDRLHGALLELATARPQEERR